MRDAGRLPGLGDLAQDEWPDDDERAMDDAKADFMAELGANNPQQRRLFFNPLTGQLYTTDPDDDGDPDDYELTDNKDDALELMAAGRYPLRTRIEDVLIGQQDPEHFEMLRQGQYEPRPSGELGDLADVWNAGEAEGRVAPWQRPAWMRR